MKQTVCKFSISKDGLGYATVTNNPKISVAFNNTGLFLAYPSFSLRVG